MNTQSNPINLTATEADLKALMSGTAQLTANDGALTVAAKGALMEQVTTLESQLRQMSERLDAMRFRQDHPLKSAVQGFKEKVKGILARITALKNKILAGAIGKLQIKEAFTSIRNDYQKSADSLERSIQKVENIGKAYHETGRGMRNFVAAFRGKAQTGTVKENGKLVAAITAPLRSELQQAKSVVARMDKIVASLETFTKTHSKTSILKPMKENAVKIAQTHATPSPERVPKKTAALA